MLVGWWVLYCVVIFTGFESVLISHLTVNTARTQPPDTMEDLVKADGWKWGLEHWVMTGVIYEYYARHTDPMVQKIYRDTENLNVDEALGKVLEDGFSLMASNYYITIHVTSIYGDARGRTPFYISKKGWNFMAFLGWGFRIGSPFFYRFHNLTLQLETAGIPTYWLWELIEQKIKENRDRLSANATSRENMEDDSGEVVLSLDYLQGAFYLWALGSTIAFLTLLGEKLAHSRLRLLCHTKSQ